MSDTEVGRIYAEVGADIKSFLAGMDMVSQSMRDTAASLGADAAEIDAALASSSHEAAAFGRNTAEAAAEASAAMSGAAADVTADAAVMAHELDNVADEARQMGRAVMEASVEAAGSLTMAAVDAVASTTAIALGLAMDSLGAISLTAILYGLAIAVGAVLVAAAPFAAAMAGIFALGAYGRVFSVWKDGTIHLNAAWKKFGSDIFDTVHQISKAVTKPLFQFLVGELKQLDAWTHTASFKKDMQALGPVMLQVGKDAIQVVRWIYQNWGTIQTILLGVLGVAKVVGQGFAWLAREAAKYWPQIKHDAEVAYQWFMANLYPGLKRAFLGIKEIVVNLAHGFQQAWPQIHQAISAAWTIIHPILDALATALGKIQDLLNWLAKNSGPAIAALATAISTVLSGVQAIISGVSSALSTLVSTLQDAKSLLGLGGGPAAGYTNKGISDTVHNHGRGPLHPATGGLITGGTPGRDSVPALLTPGELVLNSEQQRRVIQGGGSGGPRFGGTNRGHLVQVLIPDHEMRRLQRHWASGIGRA